MLYFIFLLYIAYNLFKVMIRNTTSSTVPLFSIFSKKNSPVGLSQLNTLSQSPLLVLKNSVTSKPLSLITATKKQQLINSENSRKQIQQIMLNTLPKSLPYAPIYLHLLKSNSPSAFMKCGRVSQSLRNWVCSPTELLRRRVLQSRNTLLYIAPSKELQEYPQNSSSTALIPYQQHSSALSVKPSSNQQPMKILYQNKLQMYTIARVTFNLGVVSITIHKVSLLDLLAMSSQDPSVLINCNLQPQYTITILQQSLYPAKQYLVCDSPRTELNNETAKTEAATEEPPLFNYNVYKNCSDTSCSMNEQSKLSSWTVTTQEDSCLQRQDDYLYTHNSEKSEKQQTVALQHKSSVELLHYKEAVLYHQEEEEEEEDDYDDNESCGLDSFSVEDFSEFSGSEERNLSTDFTQEEELSFQTEDKENDAFLRLVQEALEYIQFYGNSCSDELSSLEYKLVDYAQGQYV